jgi:MOSC domain-containing protein YiiM
LSSSSREHKAFTTIVMQPQRPVILREVGRIEAIFIAPTAGAPMQALTEVEAVVGVGLEGDRYATAVGFYSTRPTDPGAREVTLFEGEVLDALRAEHGIELSAAEHRRNLTVRDTRLNDLLGHRFRIGDVVLEGVKDCPPCEHLHGLVAKPVLQPLVDRGGLRARIVEGGKIRVGDAVRLEVPAHST